MLTLPGYVVIQTIAESRSSIVYRARRVADQRPVILKQFTTMYPTSSDLTHYRHEYALTEQLASDGIVVAYGLEPHGHSLVLVLEDSGSIALNQLQAGQPLPAREVLDYALQLVAILAHVHSQRIIHRDINPSNLVLNPQTKKLTLIDFGMATTLSHAPIDPDMVQYVEGTLPYLAPEQTGRMQRVIDYRSDYYALGATLYELLTGRPPFISADPLELLHAHLAVQPTPPHVLTPAVPPELSQVVLKLLTKRTEERYQSSAGLRADLEICRAIVDGHSPASPFSPGEHDRPATLTLAPQLYGRKGEHAALLDAFAQVAAGGQALVLIGGASGIGKSALVHALTPAITRQGGRLLAGKFDQLQHDIPYAALRQAFRTLMQTIVAAGAETMAAWREQMLDALGSTVQAIMEVLPELTLIVGPQPPLEALRPSEAQARFLLALHRFISLFARAEHPLVIFLDDLQWADDASWTLLGQLLADESLGHLLLIGTYRDREVGPDHPLLRLAAAYEAANGHVLRMTLTPLPQVDVTQLLVDTLRCSAEEAAGLAQVVLDRTGGNPLFASEYLKAIHAAGLLAFDQQRGAWQWRIEDLHATTIAENVVELLVQQIHGLPVAAQAALSRAAALGSQFDLPTLAIVLGESLLEAAQLLSPAVAAGLLLPQDLGGASVPHEAQARYQFFHDRVQQAAYTCIPEDERPRLHHQIGQLLLPHRTTSGDGGHLFELVNHCNAGAAYLADPAERAQVAELNLEAGTQALRAMAYDSALRYLETGIALLGVDGWARRYDLMLQLHSEAAKAASFSARHAVMDGYVQTVRGAAHTLLDRVPTEETLIYDLIAQSQRGAAVQHGLQLLQQLGVSLPAQPSVLALLRALVRTRLALWGKRDADLLALGPMRDPEKLAAIRLLISIIPAAYFTSPALFGLIVLQQVQLSVRSGIHPGTALAFSMYGIFLCGQLGDMTGGYRFAKLAQRIAGEQQEAFSRVMVGQLIHHYVLHWKEPQQAMLRPLRAVYEEGMRAGLLEFAAHAAFSYGLFLFYTGGELALITRELQGYSAVIRTIRQEAILEQRTMLQQVIHNLTHPTADPTQLAGPIGYERQLLPRFRAEQNAINILTLFAYKGLLAVVFGEDDRALVYCGQAKRHRASGAAEPTFLPLVCCDALACLALVGEVGPLRRRRLLRRARKNLAQLRRWAGHGPHNVAHLVSLVEAEQHAVRGAQGESLLAYDRAIAQAHASGVVQYAALACERAGRFCLAQGRERLAQAYLQEAHYCYTRWGALAKVAQLEHRYPQFLKPAEHPPRSTTASSSSTAQQLDLATAMKAAQVLASELVLEQLLAKMMHILIEHAGAERGYLLQERHGQWLLAASGSADRQRQIAATVEQAQRPAHPDEIPLGILNLAAHTRELVVLADASADAVVGQDPAVRQRGLRSVLCLPLLHQGTLHGVVYLENTMIANAFPPERTDVLQLLAAQAAAALERAHLYADLGASEHKYRALFEGSSDPIVISTLEGQFVDMNAAAVALSGYAREELLALPVEQLYADPPMALRVRELLAQTPTIHNLEIQVRRKDGALRDCLLSSTLRRDESGVPRHLESVIRDITERKRAEHSQLQLLAIQRELALAQQIQRSLLPSERPGWPDLDVVCHSTPAREVGGDLYAYHVIEPPDGGPRYALAVGDVSGKGMPAALLMAVSLAALQSVVGQGLVPSALLTVLDQSLRRSTSTTRQNCALVYVELRAGAVPGHLTLRAANAGCIAPLIRRADGTMTWLDVGGLPLGSRLGTTLGYQEGAATLAPGDYLVLLSDGVVEAMNADGELFGFERLEQVLAEAAPSAEVLAQTVRDAIAHFSGDGEPHDDLTILVAAPAGVSLPHDA